MDGECAFCGRSLGSVGWQVACEDCRATHDVCAACAEDVASQGEAQGLRLVA